MVAQDAELHKIRVFLKGVPGQDIAPDRGQIGQQIFAERTDRKPVVLFLDELNRARPEVILILSNSSPCCRL